MKGILEHNDDDEACFSSPRDVFEKVKSKVECQEVLGDQLEEEFLTYVSSGIQNMLVRASSESQEDPNTTAVDEESTRPTTVPAVVNEGDNRQGAGADDGLTEDDVEQTAGPTIRSKEEETIYRPMMDASESKCFLINMRNT